VTPTGKSFRFVRACARSGCQVEFELKSWEGLFTFPFCPAEFSLCTKHAISQTIAILLKDGYCCTLHLSVLTQYLNILKTRQYLKDQANVPGPRQPVPPHAS